MQLDSVSAYKLRTAQRYAEAAGSLVQELDNLMLRRPLPHVGQSDPAARADYARTLGDWYMENAGLLAAILTASQLLNDRAAADLDDVNEAADAQRGPADGLNDVGYISSLPDIQSLQNDELSRQSANAGTAQQAPGDVLFYRQALADRRNQQPKPTQKQKGRATASAEE